MKSNGRAVRYITLTTACPDPLRPPYLIQAAAIRTAGREEAAKWLSAPRDETADYRTNLQQKLAFIERNADEPDRETVSAVLETFYKREATKLKEDTKKQPTTFGNKVRSIGRGQHRS